MWDFPRSQISAVAVAGGVVALAVPGIQGSVRAVAVLVLFGCAVYQAKWILPYTRLTRHQVRDWRGPVDPDRCLRILVSNVLMTNRDPSRLLAQVREHRPHVLITLETDAWWQRRLADLGSDYPHALRCPLGNLYGMHVLSRLPLDDARTQYLVDSGIPSMHMLVMLPGGDRVRLHCLHPTPPSPTENEESTQRDAELVVVGRSVARATLPVIVTGDLNDVAWSRTTRLFQRVSGLLDPRRGRGLFCTFHAGYPIVRWPLDHVFHSDHFALVSIRRLPAMGSDHFPMLFELVLDPDGRVAAERPTADAEDQKEAQEKVEEAEAEGVRVHAPGEPRSPRPGDHRPGAG